MELLQDGLLAFLIAVGMAACVWLAAGALFGSGKCRNPELLLVLPLRGSAPAMEQDLRELLRIRVSSLPAAAIVLADCGLTEEGRRLAEYYCGRYRGIELWGGETMKEET